MKRLLPFVVLALVGCDSGPPLPTYEQLKAYPLSCAKQEQQLPELKRIQVRKRFDEDPENLDEMDRAYNSLLKEHIWWFAYRCGE